MRARDDDGLVQRPGGRDGEKQAHLSSVVDGIAKAW